MEFKKNLDKKLRSSAAFNGSISISAASPAATQADREEVMEDRCLDYCREELTSDVRSSTGSY